MTNSLMRWHLGRDTQQQLAAFCEKHRVKQDTSEYYTVDSENCFTITSHFDNGGYITAESKQGSSLSEHYQVITYELGKGE